MTTLKDYIPHNRVLDLPPVPETLTGTANPAATGAQTLDISTTSGYMYKLKGIEITVAGSQTLGNTQIIEGASTVKGTLNTNRTNVGASLRWTKERSIRGRQFCMTFHRAANAGALDNLHDDLEFPMGVTLKRVYCNLETAPGGGQTATFFLTVGAGAAQQLLQIGNVVVGENENLNISIPANTDTLWEITDSAAAGNGYTLTAWFEINEEQIDFAPQEYIPLVFHRSAAVGVGTVNIMDDLETTENLVVRRCYVNCGTGPGANNLDIILNGTTMLTINGAVIGENEALNLPLPQDVDNLVQLTDAGGLAADVTVILWCQRTDPINRDEVPADIEDIYGDVFVLGGETIRINFTQGVASQSISARVFCQKIKLK